MWRGVRVWVQALPVLAVAGVTVVVLAGMWATGVWAAVQGELEERVPGHVVDGWTHPLGGSWRWTTYRGSRSHNAGAVDFPTPLGTAVFAAADGTVTHAGWLGAYGRSVTIRHSDGTGTHYAHFSRLHVSSGARVAAGQLIGETGDSGSPGSFHLHFEALASEKLVSTTPAYRFMLRRGIELGPCVDGPCELAGYPG